MAKERSEVCPLCNKGTLAEMQGDFTTQVDGAGGRPIPLTVPGIIWRHCNSCGEDLLGEEASAAISAAHRVALKLLTADEIRSIRQKLNKTQAEISELLGIGEKTYCRWESGTHFQSEAFDRYLRALQASPSLVDLLNDIRREKESPSSSSLCEFVYLGNASVYVCASEEFTHLLHEGCFQSQSA